MDVTRLRRKQKRIIEIWKVDVEAAVQLSTRDDQYIITSLRWD